MTENIVTGKKYRILTDAANDIWDRISFWSKASDVQYDDNTTAEANKAVAILKRSASYTVGAVAYEPSAPSWVLLRCTKAGTTAAVIPSTYSTISSVGTVITDGTARFTVYDVRPSSTLSSSGYQIPAMSLVNGLNSELTANGNKFYFDYQNGKYGYNTSSSRGSSTFVPFGGTAEFIPENKCFEYYGVKFVDLPTASSPATSYQIAGTGFIFNAKDATKFYFKSTSNCYCEYISNGEITYFMIQPSSTYTAITIDQSYDYVLLRAGSSGFTFYCE